MRPASGEVVWVIANAIDAAMFSALLRAFAREIGAGPDKHVILVLDGAGSHVAKDLEVPHGIELMFLPPYSPELQPAEPLWPLTDEALAPTRPWQTFISKPLTISMRHSPSAVASSPTIPIRSRPPRCSAGGPPTTENW